MRLRSYLVIIGFFVFLFAGAGGNMALAQQDANGQEQQAVPPGSRLEKGETFLDRLFLQTYEAATGDLTLCRDNKKCIAEAKGIKFWICAAALCDGTDKSKDPMSCFEGAGNHSKDDLEKMDETICPLIKSPSKETMQAFMAVFPSDTGEDNVVSKVAYLLALKGSASSCEDYIKSYVGGYGPKWGYKWFRALSGCRILAQKSTLDQEEKDFHTWSRVARGSGRCSEIVNDDMRNECYVPGATATIAAYAQ